MPKWIIKHTGTAALRGTTFIAHEGAYISCTLSNGISASLGYAGLSTDKDYEHRHHLLNMEVDEALAYVRKHGHGDYEIFSSEKSWAARLDDHICAIRAMGCAIVVLAPEDIQSCGVHNLNYEPLISLEQAEDWLREHQHDVEEAILGDYWADSIAPLLNLYPIDKEKEPADAHE
jgi:hypothetical protein